MTQSASTISDGHASLPAKPYVVVVTPTKNEAAIIDRFLACCSTFADKIILLDQNSTDETLSIARQFPKVESHVNSDSDYSEQGRQKQLMGIARKNKTDRLLILALDADEIPTANILSSTEWLTVLNSSPGIVLHMPRLEMLPGLQRVLVHDGWVFGCMDDGTDHEGSFIHSVRVPLPSVRTDLRTSAVRVLHYSFVRSELQASKNRFYCLKENLGASRSLMERRALYRYDFIANRLNRMPNEPFNREWIAAYEAQGIDMTSISVERPNWFDQAVEAEMIKSGGVRFHFDPVWNYSYDSVAAQNKNFLLPPKGLARVLAILDRCYAAFPFKRAFAHVMEMIFKLYLRCRS